MRSGVAILGLLAACYAPSPAPGAQCSPDGHCPAALQCIAGTCQLPGSGIPDAALRDSTDAPTDSAVIVPPDGPLVCPPNYAMTPFGSCQRKVAQSKPWLDAEHACEQDQAHLVVIQTAAEANTMPSPAWIGASDRIAEGTFRTVTGPVATFINFGPGQPVGMYDCIYVEDPSGHTWSTGPCDFPFPYVCEYDGTPADPTAF